MKVLNGKNIVMRAMRRNSMYYLDAKTIQGSTLVAESNDYETWHNRLGHVGQRGMKELARKGLIQGMDPE